MKSTQLQAESPGGDAAISVLCPRFPKRSGGAAMVGVFPERLVVRRVVTATGGDPNIAETTSYVCLNILLCSRFVTKEMQPMKGKKMRLFLQ